VEWDTLETKSLLRLCKPASANKLLTKCLMATGLNMKWLYYVELTSSNCSVMAACEASVSPARHSCKIPRKIPIAPSFGCVRTSWFRWTFTHSRNNLSRTWSSGRARVISLIADRRSSMTYKQKFIVTYYESLLMYKSQDIEAKWGGGSFN